MKQIRVATCQFAVEADIAKNLSAILALMNEAARGEAKIAHFPECALSGYAGVDFPDGSHIQWKELRDATREIQRAAKQAGLWLLLGSTHYLDDQTKPHNCVYVIDARGKLVDRYDKRFCTGRDGKSPAFDLKHYTPGNRCVTFRVAGITCGVAICYDYRFPELGRAYKRLGAEVMFYSFHNARSSLVSDRKYNIWKTIVPATMQCRAAENHVWISATNSVARPSFWPSFAVRPDGLITGKLKPHRAGVLLTDMALDPAFFDAPGCWREVAMQGTLHSGSLVDHPRSRNVTEL